MKKTLLSSLIIVALAIVFSGCTHIGGGTNLKKPADELGMINITTGDGTFEDYKANGHYRSVEFGIGFGIPFVGTLKELYPAQSNADQIKRIAKDAKNAGSNAMINVEPPTDTYIGFPFFILGIYINKTYGTGIKVK